MSLAESLPILTAQEAAARIQPLREADELDIAKEASVEELVERFRFAWSV